MPLHLTIENETSLPDGGPLTYTVTGKRGIDIGRDAYLDWALPDPTRTVSGKHAEIRYRDGGYWIHDVSRNGTFLNRAAARMQEPHRLRDGDRVEIGRYIIAVRLDGEEAGASAIVADHAAPHEMWNAAGESAPPISPRDLRPARAARPAQDDFSSWAIDVPAPQPSFGAPDPFGAAPPVPPPRSFPADDMGWAQGPVPPPPPPAAPPPPLPTPRRPGAASWDAAPAPGGADPAAWGAPPAQPAAGWGAPPPPAQPAADWGAPPPPPQPAADWGAPPPPAPPQPAAAWAAPPPPPTAPPPAPTTGAAPTGWPSQVQPPPPAPPPPAPPPPAPAAPQENPWGRGGRIPPEEAAPPPSPQAPPPRAPEGQADRGGADVIARFAKGAGVAPEVLAWRSAGDLAEDMGALVRLASESLKQLLAARAESKRAARAGSHTMIQAMDNNPLKFSPSVDDAMRIMLSRPSGGYLDARRAFEEGFKDLKTHQVKTYSAMQHALRLLMEDLDPATIAESQGGEKGLGALLGSKKAKLWDLYVTRWDTMSSPHEDGMVDAFMMFFSECYDKGGK